MEYNLASMSLPLLFITLLTCTRNPILAKADLVTETCKQTPNVQLCLSTLRADSRSKTADTTILGIIMVDALKAKTIEVLAQIKKLSSKGQLKGPLAECAEEYKAVLEEDLPKAVEALTKGNPKFAEDGVIDAGMEAGYCEDGFGKLKSPLTALNKSIGDLSAVAKAIIKLLL